MSAKPLNPAIEGWFTMDFEQPRLLGNQCQSCGTYYFPKLLKSCRNPACEDGEFNEIPLSRTGKIWSYTNACYQPPEPFVAGENFEPFAIAAVHLEEEKMVVLGQVVKGVDVTALKVGMDMELVLEPLHETDEDTKVTWKWKPVTA